MQRIPQPDRARARDADVEHGLRVAEVGDGILVVVPYRPDPHGQPALARGLRAHRAHRLAVFVAVVVDHEQPPYVRGREPVGDRTRPDAVVRGDPHQRVAAQLGVGRHRRDLQQPGLAQDRRGGLHLRGVEVAQVGQRVAVARGAPRVGDRLRVAVGAEAVEHDELGGRAVGRLERELGAAQHVTPGAGGRPRERQADVDATHGAPGYTGAVRAPTA